jgi:hypothetical protein
MNERVDVAILFVGGNLVNQSIEINYEIWVKEPLDPSWSEWLNDFQMNWFEGQGTRLTGYVQDQVALHGLLAKIRDLNLTLISIIQIR